MIPTVKLAVAAAAGGMQRRLQWGGVQILVREERGLINCDNFPGVGALPNGRSLKVFLKDRALPTVGIGGIYIRPATESTISDVDILYKGR